MKSPQRIRHPQLHVALMRRVRDFLTTLLPKRSGFSHAPLSLSFPSPSSHLFYANGKVVQHVPSIYSVQSLLPFANVTCQILISIELD